jgi:hypothetical protein
LCLYGVGGAVHPDELLSRLTGRQWDQWRIYLRNFPTPMRRADINSALERANLRPAKSITALIPDYGGENAKGFTPEQLKAIADDPSFYGQV